MTSRTVVTIDNPDLPADQASIAAAIEEMGAAIADATRRIEEGEVIVLSGLDVRTRSLCAAIAGLDDAAGRQLMPALSSLTQTLDALHLALKRHPPGGAVPEAAPEAASGAGFGDVPKAVGGRPESRARQAAAAYGAAANSNDP